MRDLLAEFTLALQTRRHSAAADPSVALDGKTFRGTREASQQLHVLPAFAPERLRVLDQVAVDGSLQEPAVARQWLERLSARFPAFQVLTGAALDADQSLCGASVAAQKQYLVKVKKSQPTLPRSTPTSPNSSPLRATRR